MSQPDSDAEKARGHPATTMETYFKIRYEFDKAEVLRRIDSRLKEPGGDYVCVADGVILNTVNRDDSYCSVINGGMFAICDSSYVPLYIRWIYGRRYEQYCGSQIFHDLISARRHRMAFLGTSTSILRSLRSNLSKINPDVDRMLFNELPFRSVDEFDYPEIARMVNDDGADIIWVALGAPKQEIFMNRLRPYLRHGVMIAVGAAFKFYSDEGERRAPRWMVKNHLEFIYRIFSEPRKQLRRCGWIIYTLPSLLTQELKRKRANAAAIEKI